MYTLMGNLINNTFYKTKDEALKKINTFYAYKILTDEEYAKLMDLTTQKYPDTTINTAS